MKSAAMSFKERVANWARLQTIVSILAKHGFSGIVKDLGFGSHPKSEEESENGEKQANTPKQLRLAFEELGPTFIKLGQLLSTRPDLLPEAYVLEFTKLTDQIPHFPFSEVLEILEKELGREPYEIFSFIDENPLAAASISQVHRARLKDSEQEVVIKVQRPNIETTIQSDIHILYFVAKTLERLGKNFKLINLHAIVKEFQRAIHEELDFTLEAKNIDSFRDNFPNLEAIEIPDVIWSFTTKRILTMTELKGTPLSHITTIPASIDRKYLAESLVNFFFESMFFHGLFHADVHPGNILLIEEGEGKLGLLDFGMVGTLGTDLRQKLSKIFMATVSRDFETLSQTYIEIGEFGKKFSVREFQADISEFLAPHLGKPLREINVGELLLDSTRIARKFQVKLPRDLIMFYRSLVTLEHIGRKLDPDFEFITYGQKFAKTLLKRRFSSEEIVRDVFKMLEGLRSLGTEFPSQLKHLLQKIENDEIGLSAEALQPIVNEFKRTQKIQALSFLSFCFLMTATLMSIFKPEHFFVWSLWIFSLMSVGILIKMLFKN
ncbi:MAG: AarF/ABC1/UbiB kinase family protein [Deltaproteobacteria bacterium]|nr:AarF/ABC1/UbiB kinase family protein [Deltaproteobacteria bacterium]